jgi:putative N6-adenine-specific DNA methylase
MIETLAASIIRLSGWDGQSPLYDPFCGSGTLLTEAYLNATNTPPGFLRKRFGFEKLPDFNKSVWQEIKDEDLYKEIPKALISGSDKSQIAVNAALRNCAVVDANYKIIISVQNIFDIKDIENKTIVCNPPFGIRLEKNRDMNEFYKQLGDFFKQRCKGSTVYIYFGNRQYIKDIGLRSSWKKELSNGGLDGRLVKYELY